jgi:hypothetical protein
MEQFFPPGEPVGKPVAHHLEKVYNTKSNNELTFSIVTVSAISGDAVLSPSLRPPFFYVADGINSRSNERPTQINRLISIITLCMGTDGRISYSSMSDPLHGSPSGGAGFTPKFRIWQS